MEAETIADMETRTVTFKERHLKELRFPDAKDAAEAKRLRLVVESILTPKKPLLITPFLPISDPFTAPSSSPRSHGLRDFLYTSIPFLSHTVALSGPNIAEGLGRPEIPMRWPRR